MKRSPLIVKISRLLRQELVQSPSDPVRFRSALRNAFACALQGRRTVLYAKVTPEHCNRMLEMVEDFLFYCDPPFFSAAEKVQQLFAGSKVG